MLKYRIDKKYLNIERLILQFFNIYKGYSLNIKSNASEKVSLHKADFIIYENNKILEIAEIKTDRETQNCDAWISYHSPHTKSGDDYIKRFSNEFYNLEKFTKGFVVTIGIQMKDYLKGLDIKTIWLIQENEKYKNFIEEACIYLLKIEKMLKDFKINLFNNFFLQR